MTGTLILVRHGESEWNLKNLFTGWRNPDLTEKGVGEARAAGKRVKAAGLVPDVYFTSALKRVRRAAPTDAWDRSAADAVAGACMLSIVSKTRCHRRPLMVIRGRSPGEGRPRMNDRNAPVWGAGSRNV